MIKKASYVITQEHFQGPLDLLLDLIEREKLPIDKISLTAVTDEYLSKVKALTNIDQEALAEFLVIAAHLMLLKSRSLLPNLALSDEEEESLDDLTRRLAEYQKMKEFGKVIGGLDKRGVRLTARVAFAGAPIIFYPPPKLTLNDMSLTFQSILRALPQAQTYVEEKIRRIISLEETIKDIQRRLTTKFEQAFSEIIKGSKEKVEVIISFLAILELAKQKLITIDQKELFRDIMVRTQKEA